MFTYATKKNRYGDEHISVFAHGAEIAAIKATSSYGGKTEYIVSATTGDYLGRTSTIAGAKKKIRDWYSEHGTAVASAAANSRTADLRRLPSFDNSGFYPTPSKLAGKMLSCVDWNGVFSILEPSAGKGDLADAVSAFAHNYRNSRRIHFDENNTYIDCIERDSDLAALLRGKGLHVVHDDFLTFRSFKQYDLCIMNPPFDNGDEHLLHALSVMERGGQIVCLLNAETIRNPYTNRRKVLLQNLHEHNARIEFIENAFRHARRPTDVEIALVYVNMPKKEIPSDILSSLQRAHEKSAPNSEQATDLASADWLRNMIDGYNFEAALGEKLINEFSALRPYMDPPGREYGEPLLSLKVGGRNTGNNATLLNSYLFGLRGKYWGNLLRRPELTDKMTSAMQQDYSSTVDSLSEYDFSRYNIETVMREIAHQLSRGVEDSILELFETFSAKHSWYPESANNIHYYNGWATNTAHKVGMKVIIPSNGCHATYGGGLDTWRVNSLISDLERAMNYLDRGETTFHMPIDLAVRIANENCTNKADFTYFTCVFYKKGTCHIRFKPEAARIIDRLNIFAGQHKNWLPPTYGKKHYADMTAEEQAVIDDFQGEESYEKTIADPSMLITSGSALMALPGM